MQEWRSGVQGRRTRAGTADSRQQTARFRSHVTARGALVGMFALCLAGCLLAASWRLDALAGFAFVAGCVLAPVYARRDALLHIVISVPVIFLVAEIATQAMTAQGSSHHGSALSVLEGTFLALAGVAPWLFAGTAVCLAVAMMRGLPQCIRDVRGAARAASPRQG